MAKRAERMSIRHRALHDRGENRDLSTISPEDYGLVSLWRKESLVVLWNPTCIS